MNLQEMRDELRVKVGNPTISDVADIVLNRFINESLRHIGDRYPFHGARNIQTFPTVVGTKRYQLPTDCGTLMRVWNATERHRIHRRDMKDYANHEEQDTGVTGDPYHYHRLGTTDNAGDYTDWIQFNPIPDAIYTVGLFYKTSIADLAIDADAPTIPVTWHTGIVKYARYLFYDETQDWQRSQFAFSTWTLWLQDKPVELQQELLFDDAGLIEVPTLGGFTETGGRRLDFDNAD